MKTNKNVLRMIVIAALLGAVDYGFAAEPDQKFQGFKLQGYADDGQKAWDVDGETADIIGTKIKLNNVVANSYGEQKVNLTAEKGSIDQVSSEMHLEKDVVITSETGAQLVTDSLNWDRNKDLVTTKDDVLITDKGFSVTGTGMKAQPGLKNAEIHEDVTVLMMPEPTDPDGKTVTITCDGPMIVDQGKSMATFEKNVVAVRGDQTLKADRMELYFDGETKKIQDLICLGHVEIVQGENQTFADKAVYKANEQKLVLSGRPKLIMLTEDNDAFKNFGDEESR